MSDINASVTQDGAILLGKLFSCDGHVYGRGHFVFSHMHSDHTDKLSKCLHNGKIYLSKPTRDLLEAINDENYGSDPQMIKRSQIEILDFGRKKIVNHDDVTEILTLHESNHVLGASQVEVITKEGQKIVYSGDITNSDQPLKDINTLVLDATHGHPQYSKYSDKESVERRFIDKIDEVIHNDRAQPVVIHAHQGKLQEIMSLISNHSEFNDFPLHTSSKSIRISKVYQKYDFNIRDDLVDEKSDEAETARESGWPYIQCTSHFSKKTYEINGKAYSIFVYDSLPDGSQINENENSTSFSTTSHADFDNIIKYVQNACPKFIIVDSTRTNQYKSLVKELRDRGFNVQYQPKRK